MTRGYFDASPRTGTWNMQPSEVAKADSNPEGLRTIRSPVGPDCHILSSYYFTTH